MIFVPFTVGGAFLLLVMLYHNWVHVDDDPSRYVEDLRDPQRATWESASRLAAMLCDPDYSHLKQDRQLASELGELLDRQITSGCDSEADIRMQVFFCRALGEFTIDDGLAILIRAADPNTEGVDTEVRCAALEAIAVLTGNLPPDDVRSNRELTRAVIAASEANSTENGNRQRARAAYCLGVIGSPAAVDQLAKMLADPHPNARFNAATGLARHGDDRCVAILAEMLDPNAETVVAGETEESGRNWKRQQVQLNALAGAKQLLEKNSSKELAGLATAIDDLLASDASDAVTELARTTQAMLPEGN